MTDIDKRTLQIETLILMFVFLLYGTGRMDESDAIVVLLFICAAMLSMLKYRAYTRGDS